MAYCVKCGAKVDEGMEYCPQCGAQIPKYDVSRRNDTESFQQEDVSRNKLMGVLSYLGVLVLVPLLAGDKASEYVRFHTNQGLVLFIASAITTLLSGGRFFGLHSLISFENVWFGWIFDVIGLVLFVFMIIGIVHACKGEKKELPLIGQIRILK